MNVLRSKIVLSAVAGVVFVTRLVSPELLDTTDMVLIAVALLPWLSSLIKSVEFPGGLKIELQDVQRAGAKVTGGGTIEPPDSTQPLAFLMLSDTDPNIALISLRIELERRIKALAGRHSLDTRQPLMRLFRELQKRGILADPVLSGLRELVNFGNQAAHGAVVDPHAAAWAIHFGPTILAVLDDHISNSN